MGKLAKRVSSFIFAISAISAQNVVLSIGSGTGTPSGAVVVPITLATSGGAQPAGLQWSFSYPAGITGVGVVVGTTAINAQKLLNCAGSTCIIYGLNTNNITDGFAATATFQLSPGASGTIPISLTNVVAASAAADSIPTGSGSGSIVVTASQTSSLNSVGCTVASIATPGSTSCTVTLPTAAPAGGFLVSLSSNNANLSVPTSVTVAAGQTTATFSATGATVNTDQPGIVISASAAGVTRTTSINLLAPTQQLQSLSCSSSAIGSNATSTCTATLNRNASSPVGVSLASNNLLVSVPSSVTIPTGQASVTFLASSGVVTQNQSALITGSVNGNPQSFTLNLTVSVQLSGLSCSPTSFSGPGTSTCTISLSGAAPANTSATVSSDNAKVTVPGAVTFDAGQSSATFTATIAAATSNQTATLTVNLNGILRSASISLVIPSLSTLSCSPLTLNSNQSADCTLFLDRIATTPTVVGLASSKAALQLPSSVTVPAGSNTATFSVTTSNLISNDQAVVTATLNGQDRAATLNLVASLQISALTCAPTSVTSNGSTLCTVRLSQPAANTLSVGVSSNVNTLAVPSSVTIASGQTSATFNATAGTITTGAVATVTATLNGQIQTAAVTLSSATVQLSAISCSPAILQSSGTATCTVSLASSGLNAIAPAIAANNPALTVPAAVMILGGNTSTIFQIVAGVVASPQTVTLTASLTNGAVTTSIQVLPPNAPAIQLISPASYKTGNQCSPGAIASVMGSGFTSQAGQNGPIPWPTQLASVQVLVDNQPAPLLYASDTLIHFQCPYVPVGTTLSIIVRPEFGPPTTPLLTITQEATPGAFFLDHAHHGAIFIANTYLVATADDVGRIHRPAKKGEYISIFADGLGPVSPNLPPGMPALVEPLSVGLDQVQVVIGDSAVTLTPSFVGLTPTVVSVFVVNVQLTNDVPTGAEIPVHLDVTLSNGTVVSTNTVFISVDGQ